MEQVPEPSKPVQCKLCAAFAASQLLTASERGFPGSETFSRDPEICDACLAHDYSARGPLSSEWWAGQFFGCWFALITFMVLEYRRRQKGFRHVSFLGRSNPMLVDMLIAILAGACLAIITWLLFALWMGRWSRSQATEAEIAASVERFRWLARWAELTGRKRFCKRMLKQAAALDAQGTGDAGAAHE